MTSSLLWKYLSRLLVSTGFAVGLCALAAPLPEGFTVHKSGPAWRVETGLVPDGVGGVAPGITASFPGNTWSEPGQFAAVGIPVAVPEDGPAVLSFRLADTFTGPTVGFHFAEVLVGETILFERDVAGGTTTPEIVEIDLRKAMPEGGRATLDFRLADRKAVSNFPVSVYFIDPVLKTPQGVFDKKGRPINNFPVREGDSPIFPAGKSGQSPSYSSAAPKRLLPPARIEPPEPLAPDLPLPSLPLTGEGWTRTARIVQPWGPSQWDAIARADERAPWLAQTFGFDAVIVLPPEAHNAITGEEHHITEARFNAALRAYRAAGFRIVLYTSIMHCGHAPVWQSGSLSKSHPAWSQRGPKGEPVTVYGAEWLCPSTGALPFTIEYTRGLIARYAPDAVMLDNNEFFTTPSGLTCHCAGCRTGFRRYLKARFGDAVFGKPTAEMKIPTEPGALYNVWLRWRNRVWAEATERFRVELRRESPDVVVLANTQYLRSSPDLATDLQYAHEDAVLSESRGMTTDGMIDKLLLGQALAGNRPLWNYLGTFQGGDLGRLVSPEMVSMNVSTAFACGARPWVVYYGFFEDPEANKPALDRMATTLQWHRAHDPARRGLKPYAPVLSLVSLTSRNCRGTPLIPQHLTALRQRGVCARMVEEQALSEGGLEGCRVFLIEEAPCLSEASIAAIAGFVREGGVLIAPAETGLFDEIGRLRPKSGLWAELGVIPVLAQSMRVGKGTVIAMRLPAPWEDVAEWLEPARFHVEPETEASVLPYVDRDGQFVVYVCSQRALPAGVRVRAPEGASGSAILCSPDQPEPRVVNLSE